MAMATFRMLEASSPSAILKTASSSGINTCTDGVEGSKYAIDMFPQ
jgi:hypothetical protein